jgi:hypothetical protein
LGTSRRDVKDTDSAKSEALCPDTPLRDQKARTLSKVKNKDEKVNHQVGGAAVWQHYLKSIGILHSLLLLLFTLVAVSASNSLVCANVPSHL